MLSTWSPRGMFHDPLQGNKTKGYKHQRVQALTQRSSVIAASDTKLRPQEGVVFFDQVHMTLPQVQRYLFNIKTARP
jgi:hypothetical protein